MPDRDLPPPQLELLRAVHNEECGWASRTFFRTRTFTQYSYKRWLNEHDYVLVTKPIEKLLGLGLVERVSNPHRMDRGPMDCTREGVLLLREIDAR